MLQNIYDHRQIAFSFFFPAPAQESDVKEIHSHVDSKSIKRILRARQGKHERVEKWGPPE